MLRARKAALTGNKLLRIRAQTLFKTVMFQKHFNSANEFEKTMGKLAESEKDIKKRFDIIKKHFFETESFKMRVLKSVVFAVLVGVATSMALNRKTPNSAGNILEDVFGSQTEFFTEYSFAESDESEKGEFGFILKKDFFSKFSSLINFYLFLLIFF